MANGLDLSAINGALHARIPRLELVEIDQTRLGLTASLEWRPDEKTRLAWDTLYAELRSERMENLLETLTLRTAGACSRPAPPQCGINAVTVTDARIKDFGGHLPVLIAGRFDGVDLRSEARYDRLNTIFRQTTLAGTRDFDNGVKASVLAGFSRSDFSNPVQQTLHLEQTDINGFAYDFSDRKRPGIDFGDADLLNAAPWALATFRSEPNWVDNSFKTLALDLEGKAGALSWRTGALHKSYRTAGAALMRTDGSIANINSDVPASWLALPVESYGQRVGQGVSFGVTKAPDQWLSIDMSRALGIFQADCAAAGCSAFRVGAAPAANLNYAVTEQANSVYAQAALPRSDDRAFWGEAGVRLVRTEVQSRGLGLAADATVREASATDSYWSTLPSLNLAWSAAETVVVRFGAAQVMVRPELVNMRPGVGISTTGTKLVTSGNPTLRPTRARTLDLSVDWWPKDEFQISVAGYHKAISTAFQSTVTRPMMFSDNPFGLPDSVAAIACGSSPGCSPTLPIWQFSRPENAGPGRLVGVEAAFRAPLGALRPGVSRWILQGAIAYTRTNVRLIDKTGVLVEMEDALGGPRLAASLSATYHRQRFEARGSMTYRGRYLATVPAPNGGDVDGVDPLFSLDMTARYAISQRLWLTAQGANLTRATQRQFSDQTLIPTYQHQTGRVFVVGAQWSF